MSEDLTQDAVANQAQAQAESGAQEQTGGGDSTQAIGETTGVQSEQADNAKEEGLGPDNLAPELESQRKELLRDYHAKTQKYAAEKRDLEAKLAQSQKDSEVLQALMQKKWFVDAANAEKARRSGFQADLTDEEFESVRSDKRSFQEFLTRRDKALEAKLAEQIEMLKKDTQSVRIDRELDTLKAKYKDYGDVQGSGAMDKYLEKGYDREDAYKLAKQDSALKDTTARLQEEAARLLAAKKAGSVDKGGVPRTSGSRVIKVKPSVSFHELFDLAHEEVRNGRDFVLEKER